jgi:hypothetical protein
MQAFCLGQIISGVIRGFIIALIGTAVGYLILGLGNGILWFLVGGMIVFAIAILGGVIDLVAGLFAGILLRWALLGLENPLEIFEALLSTNLEFTFDSPQKAAGVLLTTGVFILGVFIASILLSFIKPGSRDGNVELVVSIVIGLVAGGILFLIYGRVPSVQFVKTISILAGILGFVVGLKPGPPLL